MLTKPDSQESGEPQDAASGRQDGGLVPGRHASRGAAGIGQPALLAARVRSVRDHAVASVGASLVITHRMRMMESKDPAKAPSPSQFMRQLRPELYSDSTSRIQYRLKAEILSHYLDTLTERNQTHDFELFCRKLCERTICPNLRPATGPEGGGDSKADTETSPVADEISKLTYVGTANSGSERWAFAFSAKKTWAEKARSDVAGIVATGRSYQRIIFVTSRAARAKDRARLEDELSQTHGVPVTIHDRTWIIDEVIGKDRRDLAFHYLGIGEESSDRDLGPSDYSRTKQLAEIERS